MKSSFLHSMLIFFLTGLFSYSAQAQQATQKLSEVNKKWRVHWGVYGGAGVANALGMSYFDYMDYYTMDENGNYVAQDVQILHAPRPEAKLGFSCEIEMPKIVSFQLGIGYMMRAVPKPSVGVNGQPAEKKYASTVLNGAHWNGTLFFRANNKIKFGLGFESAFMPLYRSGKMSSYDMYTESHTFSHGVTTVVSYSVNPRLSLNFYAMASTGMYDLGFNNISAGMTVGYRIRGKEIRLKKEVYKLDYTLE